MARLDGKKQVKAAMIAGAIWGFGVGLGATVGARRIKRAKANNSANTAVPTNAVTMEYCFEHYGQRELRGQYDQVSYDDT